LLRNRSSALCLLSEMGLGLLDKLLLLLLLKNAEALCSFFGFILQAYTNYLIKPKFNLTSFG